MNEETTTPENTTNLEDQQIQQVEVTNEVPFQVEVTNEEPQLVEVTNEEQKVIFSEEQFNKLIQTIEANKPFELSGNTTATISQDQMNHLTEMYNDSKVTNFTSFTILIGIILGYIAIKGLLSQWKL